MMDTSQHRSSAIGKEGKSHTHDVTTTVPSEQRCLGRRARHRGVAASPS